MSIERNQLTRSPSAEGRTEREFQMLELLIEIRDLLKYRGNVYETEPQAFAGLPDRLQPRTRGT